MAEVTKQQVLEIIEALPDDSSLEDIMYELYVRSELEAGLDDFEHGRTVSSEEVLQKISAWRQSAGR